MEIPSPGQGMAAVDHPFIDANKGNKKQTGHKQIGPLDQEY